MYLMFTQDGKTNRAGLLSKPCRHIVFMNNVEDSIGFENIYWVTIGIQIYSI
jgi:hypothetical protein